MRILFRRIFNGNYTTSFITNGNLLPKLFDGVSEVLDRDVVLVDRTHPVIGRAVVVLVPTRQITPLICVHTVPGVPVVVARPPWHVCMTQHGEPNVTKNFITGYFSYTVVSMTRTEFEMDGTCSIHGGSKNVRAFYS
jgi:hypothetical protein